MTQAAQAQKKRMQTRGDGNCVRPDHLPKNAPRPHYAWVVGHAMIRTDGIVYRAMESLKPQAMRGKRSRLVKHSSTTEIAQATKAFDHVSLDGAKRAIPRRTVAHSLARMASRGIIHPWEESGPKQSPKGASWVLPHFDDILQRWHDDPNIGTVGVKRAFCVVSKSHRLCTTQELIDWKVDFVKIAADPASHAMAADVGEPDVPAEPAKTSKAPSDEELKPLMNAFIDACGGATEKDTRRAWWKTAKKCGERPIPSVEDLVGMVHVIRHEWNQIGKQAPINTELMGDKLLPKVEAWQRNAPERRRQSEDRIGRMMRDMEALERADLDNLTRLQIEAALAKADLLEVAESRRRMAQQATRAG